MLPCARSRLGPRVDLHLVEARVDVAVGWSLAQLATTVRVLTFLKTAPGSALSSMPAYETAVAAPSSRENRNCLFSRSQSTCSTTLVLTLTVPSATVEPICVNVEQSDDVQMPSQPSTRSTPGASAEFDARVAQTCASTSPTLLPALRLPS